jgi:hypothetical protein
VTCLENPSYTYDIAFHIDIGSMRDRLWA